MFRFLSGVRQDYVKDVIEKLISVWGKHLQHLQDSRICASNILSMTVKIRLHESLVLSVILFALKRGH